MTYIHWNKIDNFLEEWATTLKMTGLDIDLDDYVDIEKHWNDVCKIFGKSVDRKNKSAHPMYDNYRIQLSPNYGEDLVRFAVYDEYWKSHLFCKKGRVYEIVRKALLVAKKPSPCGYKKEIDLLKRVCKGIKQSRIHYSYGVLLHGPPGNGKTMLCRKLATMIESAWVRGSNLQQLISDNEIFNRRQLYILDDVDISFFSRKSGNTLACDLLSALDGESTVPNVRLFCTNEPIDSFDSAFLRPGRIDQIIEFSPPSNKDVDKFVASFAPEDLAIIDGQVDRLYGCSYAEIDSIRKYADRQRVIGLPINLEDILAPIGRSKEGINKIGF